MFHPYQAGYSVLPALRKISAGEIFLPCPDLGRYLEAKAEARRSQQVVFEADMDPAIYRAVTDFIRLHHPLRLLEGLGFHEVAGRIPEDLVIHRLGDGRDWFAAGNICLPSSWEPAEKIGRPWAEIHAPVPGMDLTGGRKLVEAMVYRGPFERFVWSVVFDDRLNYHPSRPRPAFAPERVFVKVERQVTVGFPDHRAALFVLRQYVVQDIDREALTAAVAGMTPEELAYKGLAGCRDELLACLRKNILSSVARRGRGPRGE